MKIKLAIAAVFFAAAAVLAGCTEAEAPPTVSGTITDKYVEDFTEYQLVVEETGTKTKHHFEVDPGTWRASVVGQPYSVQQLQETDD